MTTTETELKTVKPVKTLVNAYCVADMGRAVWGRTSEDRAKSMEQLCKDFNDFIRDHRSMDHIRLSVVREHETVCSSCLKEWEYDAELKGCAWCGLLSEVEAKHD